MTPAPGRCKTVMMSGFSAGYDNQNLNTGTGVVG
jgi:hypothetical protein